MTHRRSARNQGDLVFTRKAPEFLRIFGERIGALAIDQPGVGCGVAFTFDFNRRGGCFERVYIFRTEFDRRTAEILFESRKFGGAGNRDDSGLLCQQPGESDLRRRGSLLLRELRDYVDERLVRFPVSLAKAR